MTPSLMGELVRTSISYRVHKPRNRGAIIDADAIVAACEIELTAANPFLPQDCEPKEEIIDVLADHISRAERL